MRRAQYRVRLPCCGWYVAPPPLTSPTLSTCPFCGHWLLDQGDGGGPRIVEQDYIERMARYRPEYIAQLSGVTAALVSEHAGCQAAHGHA